jgi:asparagine synthase (glutamine-hydrolysing)
MEAAAAMCGIAGWIGHLEGSKAKAGQVAALLRHRGPDASGHKIWPHAGLVHTRLSIIDLSETGAQPMPNEDGMVWVVFNGEIYNHRDLRRDLEKRGHRFRGTSDTEVLVHLYEERGTEMLPMLRGMFAFGIMDLKADKLLVARDRFGIKPVFICEKDDLFAFASEIRSLKALASTPLSVDRQAVYDYAALFYIPAPATLYREFKAVLPGEFVEVSRDRGGRAHASHRRFHKWAVTIDRSLDLKKAVDIADGLVDQAVRRQLESDVPLGSLLSGGIDSSLVSDSAQKALSGPLQTFNVKFPDAGYDETWAATMVAEAIGSRHTVLEMNDFKGSWNHISDTLLHCGQPFADTSLFAVNAVCCAMRKHVTVALSGDGGDEGFSGYDSYKRLRLVELTQRLPGLAWDCAELAARLLARAGLVGSGRPERIVELSDKDDLALTESNFAAVHEAEHFLLCRDRNMLPVRRHFECQWHWDGLERDSRYERLFALAVEANVRLTLPNDFLFKVDAASMKESLEVRVPMLDEDLFAFGLSIPFRLRTSHSRGKLVLRKVAAKRFPATIAEKPKKGFGIPVDAWADPAFKLRLRDELFSLASMVSVFFEPAFCRPIVEAFSTDRRLPGISRSGVYQRVVMLFALHLAFEKGHSSEPCAS